MASSHCPGADHHPHWRIHRPASDASSSPRSPAPLSSTTTTTIANVRPVPSFKLENHDENSNDNGNNNESSFLLALPVQSLPGYSHASLDWQYSSQPPPILLVAAALCYCCCYYYYHHHHHHQYNYNNNENKDSDPQYYLMNGVEMMMMKKKNDRVANDDFCGDDKQQSETEQGWEEFERLKNNDEDAEIDDHSSSGSTTTATSDDDEEEEEEEEDWFGLLADGILDGYVTLQDVQRQITAHPEWLGQTSKVTGYSLLHCACDGLYSMEIVEYLLQQQQQQDVGQRNDLMTGTLMDHNRWTPLHCACDNANPLTLDCVKLLLQFEEQEQPKRQRSSSSVTSSARSTFGGSSSSSQWIRARTMAGETPLFLACQSGRTAILHWQFPNTQTIRWLAEQWPLACVLKAASSSSSSFTVSGSQHPDAFSMMTNESVSKNDDNNTVHSLERYAVRYECPLDVVEDYKEIAEGYFEASAGSAATSTPPALRSDANNLSHSNSFYQMPDQVDAEDESIDAEAYLYDDNDMSNEADDPLEQDDSKIFLSQLQDSLQANETQVLEYFDLVEFLTNQTERVEHDLVQAAMTHGPYGCITQRDFDELLCCSCCNNNNNHNHSSTNMKQRSCLRQALSPEPLRQLWDTVAAMHAAGRLDAVSPNATRKHAVQVCAAVAATKTTSPIAAATGEVGGHHHHYSRKKKTNAVADGLWLHLRENPRLCDRQKQAGSENYINDAKVSKKNKAVGDRQNNEAEDESIRHEIKRQRLHY